VRLETRDLSVMSVPLSFYVYSLVFCVLVAVIMLGLLAAGPFLRQYVYFQMTAVIGLALVIAITLWTIVRQAQRTQSHLRKAPYETGPCPDYWKYNSHHKTCEQNHALAGPPHSAASHKPSTIPSIIPATIVSDGFGREACAKYADSNRQFPWVDVRKTCQRLGLTPSP